MAVVGVVVPCMPCAKPSLGRLIEAAARQGSLVHPFPCYCYLFFQRPSTNMDDSGFFSVQVGTHADIQFLCIPFVCVELSIILEVDCYLAVVT